MSMLGKSRVILTIRHFFLGGGRGEGDSGGT
jgi:hypothetical protein